MGLDRGSRVGLSYVLAHARPVRQRLGRDGRLRARRQGLRRRDGPHGRLVVYRSASDRRDGDAAARALSDSGNRDGGGNDEALCLGNDLPLPRGLPPCRGHSPLAPRPTDRALHDFALRHEAQSNGSRPDALDRLHLGLGVEHRHRRHDGSDRHRRDRGRALDAEFGNALEGRKQLRDRRASRDRLRGLDRRSRDPRGFAPERHLRALRGRPLRRTRLLPRLDARLASRDAPAPSGHLLRSHEAPFPHEAHRHSGRQGMGEERNRQARPHVGGRKGRPRGLRPCGRPLDVRSLGARL